MNEYEEIINTTSNLIYHIINKYFKGYEKEDLYQALRNLIEDIATRTVLQANAYMTVSKAFSLEKWQRRWLTLLQRQ